jgi:hypothetical protein
LFFATFIFLLLFYSWNFLFRINNSRKIRIFSAHYFNDDFFPYGKTFAYLKGLGFDSFQVMQSSLRSSFLYKEKNEIQS